ncbi:Uncharacterised protein [Collinsella intestinalis]|nr:Uncharacterised protein [Collinsella intestinalis]
MAAEQVEAAGQRLGRVVFTQRLDALGALVGVLPVNEKTQDGIAQRVVHGRVELVTQQVFAQLAVGEFVGCILPDLAEQQAVGAFLKHRCFDVLNKLVRELIGHVETPAACTGAQPGADHAVFTEQQLAHTIGLLVEVGHVLDAPPGAVCSVFVPAIRVIPGRFLALPCTLARVVPKAIEIDGVVSRVVEYAVEDERDAQLIGVLGEATEVLLGSEHGVDREVIGRVVAVITLRFEDGVEVDRRDAHGVQAGEVLADSLERSAVEVPALDGFVLVALVYRRFVPVHHQVLARALAGLVDDGLGALEPVLVARVTIGENLVHDAALVPSGTGFAVLIHGDLERGDVCAVGIGDRLSARGAIARADLEHRPIGACHAEAVP